MRACSLALLACLLPGCMVLGNGVAKQQDRDVDPFDTIELTDIVDVRVVDGGPVDRLVISCDENVIEMIDTHVYGGVLTVGVGGGSVSSSTPCEVVTGNMALEEIVSTGVGDIAVRGPAWSLETIRSESVGHIRVDLREAQAVDEEEPEGGDELYDAPDAQEGGPLQDAPDEDAPLESEDESGSSSEQGQQPDQTMPVTQADHLFLESLDLGEVTVTGLDRASVEVRAEGVGEIELEGRVALLGIELVDLTEVRARHLTATEVDVFSDGVGDVTVTALERVDIENWGLGTITVYGDPASRRVVNDSVGEVKFR